MWEDEDDRRYINRYTAVLLGDEVVRYRWQRDLTQAALADRAGVSQSWISRVENSQELRVGLAYGEALADALSVELDEITKQEVALDE